ncbi:MAG: hypothetical protein FK733_10020 [Asgard group archaeon]|nr:hypothetical protein [Asgard group archaeon]
MGKPKYVKVCPFLRDLGDSFLCVNNDKVADVIKDPLINIEWSEKLPPVSSSIPEQDTCLFVIEIEDDDRLFCISRQIYLRMDRRDILWEDIRDSVVLLDLANQSEFQDSEINFCSSCLYKVLIASSPAFQLRLGYHERLDLGSKYILNRANEIYTSVISMTEKLSMNNDPEVERCNIKKIEKTDHPVSALSLLSWINGNIQIDDVFSTTMFEWLQKFDEWMLIIMKLANATEDNLKIIIIEESFEFAARLKEIAFEIIMRLSFVNNVKEKVLEYTQNMEKLISIASIQFEDYMFIVSQFLKNIREEPITQD